MGNGSQISPSVRGFPSCQAHQAQKHLRGDERIAGRRVAIVRDNAEHLAQRVEREAADGRASSERAIALEMKGAVPSYPGCG